MPEPQPTGASVPESAARAPRRARAVRRARAATYLAVGGAAALAVYLTPAPRPAPDASALLGDSVITPPVPAWRARVDTLGKGETLVGLLQRAGVARVHAADALRAAGESRSLPAGVRVMTVSRPGDSLATEITYKPAVDRVVHLQFLSGVWQRFEQKLAWQTDTLVARAAITSSVNDALHTALGERLPRAQRSAIVWKLADIFEYRVDMSHDLHAGDSVRVLVERKIDPEGQPRDARILAASLSVSGKDVEAIRYERRSGSTAFFDQYGKSLRAAFLRAPLEFRRVSSVFGMRNHPVLGTWRMHKGTDYAASSGTPVRSIGDGTVIFAGRKSGFGNVVEVRHSNGYVSRYGHLRGFAKGVRRGTSVAIGRTIGFVGMTGLATAPHLHFEMLVDGVQRDPRKALRDKVAEPIPTREKSSFAALRSRLLNALGIDAQPSTAARVAATN